MPYTIQSAVGSWGNFSTKKAAQAYLRRMRDSGKVPARAKVVRIGNPGEITGDGDWIPCHAVKELPNGDIAILTERQSNPSKKKMQFGFKDLKGLFHRIPNESISQGFYGKDGKFHPIRSADDYDPEAVGEESKRPRKRKKAATRKRKR